MPHCVELLFALRLETVNKSGIIDWKVIYGYLLMKGNVMHRQRQKLQLNGGRMMHKLTIIGSPGRYQAIIWTNAGIMLSGSLGTNFNKFL